MQKPDERAMVNGNDLVEEDKNSVVLKKIYTRKLGYCLT